MFLTLHPKKKKVKWIVILQTWKYIVKTHVESYDCGVQTDTVQISHFP